MTTSQEADWLDHVSVRDTYPHSCWNTQWETVKSIIPHRTLQENISHIQWAKIYDGQKETPNQPHTRWTRALCCPQLHGGIGSKTHAFPTAVLRNTRYTRCYLAPFCWSCPTHLNLFARFWKEKVLNVLLQFDLQMRFTYFIFFFIQVIFISLLWITGLQLNLALHVQSQYCVLNE